MPLTVKLSRKFYDKFGDDIVDEFVSVLNAVDTGYRHELRELTETYFVRFEAKLHEETAGVRAELREEIAGLRSQLREEIAAVRSDLHGEIADLRSDLREQIAGLRADIIKWMFIFWIGTMGTTVAVVFAVVSMLR